MWNEAGDWTPQFVSPRSFDLLHVVPNNGSVQPLETPHLRDEPIIESVRLLGFLSKVQSKCRDRYDTGPLGATITLRSDSALAYNLNLGIIDNSTTSYSIQKCKFIIAVSSSMFFCCKHYWRQLELVLGQSKTSQRIPQPWLRRDTCSSMIEMSDVCCQAFVAWHFLWDVWRSHDSRADCWALFKWSPILVQYYYELRKESSCSNMLRATTPSHDPSLSPQLQVQLRVSYMEILKRRNFENVDGKKWLTGRSVFTLWRLYLN